MLDLLGITDTSFIIPGNTAATFPRNHVETYITNLSGLRQDWHSIPEANQQQQISYCPLTGKKCKVNVRKTGKAKIPSSPFCHCERPAPSGGNYHHQEQRV
jgi:hypothetical protein